MIHSLKKGQYVATRTENIIEARFSLTSKQNDILDMLMCEIENDDRYQYVLSVDKYKELYHLDTSNIYRDLEKAVKSFEGKGFRLLNKITGDEIYYAWFSKIHYKKKIGEIQVNIDLDFKKLLCEVKKRIYYQIEYTLNLKSVYSKRVYYYLKSFEDTGWRIDCIDALQQKLECPKSYKNFAIFKQNVLDRSNKEINEGSDINFKYEIIKDGNKFSKIKFFVTSKSKTDKYLQEEIAIGMDDIKVKEIDIKSDQINLVNKVREFISEDISDVSIKMLLKVAKNNVDIIKEKYKIMKKQKLVGNIIGWLRDAIIKDYKPEQLSFVQQSAFNNFEGRNYSKQQLDDIENKLLGCK